MYDINMRMTMAHCMVKTLLAMTAFSFTTIVTARTTMTAFTPKADEVETVNGGGY